MPLTEAKSLFDSVTFRILVRALDSGQARALAENPRRDMATAVPVLAARIIALAKAGERDENRLILAALAHLRETEQIEMSRRRVEAGENYAATSYADTSGSESETVVDRMVER
jgi:hypothetical protein